MVKTAIVASSQNHVIYNAPDREKKAMIKFYKLLDYNKEDLDLILNGLPKDSIFDNNDLEPITRTMTFHDAFHIVKHFLRLKVSERNFKEIEIETADIEPIFQETPEQIAAKKRGRPEGSTNKTLRENREKVRQYREDLGMSFTQIANTFKVSRQTVSDFCEREKIGLEVLTE
jgi:DNA-binding XRE family transcriptional regulator